MVLASNRKMLDDQIIALQSQMEATAFRTGTRRKFLYHFCKTGERFACT